MTAPSKVSEMPRAGISAARAHKPRKFPVSDGAPVEVVEDGASLAGRLHGARRDANDQANSGYRQLCSAATVAVRVWSTSHVACCGLHPARCARRSRCRTATRSWSAPVVLPADGKRRVIIYMHGGGFLTCGVSTPRPAGERAVEVRRQPGAGRQLPDDPEALRRHGARRLLRRLQVAAPEGLRARPDRARRRLGGRVPGAGAGRAAAAGGSGG